MILSETTLRERRGEQRIWGQVILNQEKKRSLQRSWGRGTRWWRRTTKWRGFPWSQVRKLFLERNYCYLSSYCYSNKIWPGVLLELWLYDGNRCTLTKAGSMWRIGVEKCCMEQLQDTMGRQKVKTIYRSILRSFAAEGNRGLRRS